MKTMKCMAILLLMVPASCRSVRTERELRTLSQMSVAVAELDERDLVLGALSEEYGRDSTVERFREWTMTDSAGRLLSRQAERSVERHRVNGSARTGGLQERHGQRVATRDSLYEGGALEEVTVKAPRSGLAVGWLLAFAGLVVWVCWLVVKRRRP